MEICWIEALMDPTRIHTQSCFGWQKQQIVQITIDHCRIYRFVVVVKWIVKNLCSNMQTCLDQMFWQIQLWLTKKTKISCHQGWHEICFLFVKIKTIIQRMTFWLDNLTTNCPFKIACPTTLSLRSSHKNTNGSLINKVFTNINSSYTIPDTNQGNFLSIPPDSNPFFFVVFVHVGGGGVAAHKK